MTSKFLEKPYKERVVESNNIMTKYPDKIPIIVYPSKNCGLPELDRSKFLVSKDLTVGQFLYIIRKRMKLDSCKALFMFTEKNTIPVTHEPIKMIYENHKNKDGFLYFQYSSENTFG